LSFPFHAKRGLVLKFFLQGLDPVGFFLLNWIKVKYWIVGHLGFSTVSFGNSVLDIGSFWFFVACLFIGFAGYWKFWFFAIIAFYSIGFGFWFWFLLGY